MEKKKVMYIIGKIAMVLVLIFGMFVCSGMALLGMSIMNLTVTLLSFDEMFIESPFNQTKMGNLNENLSTVVWTGMFTFMIGLFLAIICALLIIWVVSLRFDDKIEESSNSG